MRIDLFVAIKNSHNLICWDLFFFLWGFSDVYQNPLIKHKHDKKKINQHKNIKKQKRETQMNKVGATFKITDTLNICMCHFFTKRTPIRLLIAICVLPSLRVLYKQKHFYLFSLLKLVHISIWCEIEIEINSEKANFLKISWKIYYSNLFNWCFYFILRFYLFFCCFCHSFFSNNFILSYDK